MPTLSEAVDQSTYVVDLTFTDESGGTIVPAAIAWSLRDASENIVNSRQDVSVTPATSVTIVLSGDDLIYDKHTGASRTLTIVASYDSSVGTGLPLIEEYSIPIRSIIGV